MFDLLVRYHRKEIPFGYLHAKLEKHHYKDETLSCIIFCSFLVQIIFANRYLNEYQTTWKETDFLLSTFEKRLGGAERQFARRNIRRPSMDRFTQPAEETELTYFEQMNGPEGQPRHTAFSEEELYHTCIKFLKTYNDHLYDLLVYFARTLLELPKVFDKSILTEHIRKNCKKSVAESWDHLLSLWK